MRAMQTAALGLAIIIGIIAAPTSGIAQADRMAPKGTMDAMSSKPMHGAMVMGAGDHAASGHVTLATVNGRQVLRLDEGFEVDKGPDVWVLLSRDGKPMSNGAVSIVKLTQHRGAQEITLPANVDPAQFTHVVFYCKKYNVMMGSAALASAKPMMDGMKQP